MTGVPHLVLKRGSVRPDRRAALRVLSFPRDPNPYQELLHAELRRRGTVVSYLGSETPSQSLNVALLPVRIAIGRVRGVRVVHVHWLYPFGLRWTRRSSLRWLRGLLLSLTLRTARLCGVRVVWTLHNVVPHTPLFADDRGARRRLVDACDLVIAHSQAALDDLRHRTGAEPRRARVIPLGPFAPRAPRIPRRASRHVAFFGKVESYKGVEELLAAFAALPPDCPLRLTVAGACPDASLRRRIERRAEALGTAATLRLEHLPAEAVDEFLADVDALVLPFRDVTTTSTVNQAQARGVPVVIPDLPNLRDVQGGAIRYDGSVADLIATLEVVSRFDATRLDALGAAAYGSAHDRTWADVAAETLDAYELVVGGRS
jgi:glycosyltransferase involved in cell wall biosynthesis